MVLAVIGVVIQAGTPEPADHRHPQSPARSSASTGWATPTSSPSSSPSSIFMIAVQAELTQTPVRHADRRVRAGAGYQTEYSGFRFLIFFIAEFATAGVFALIASCCSSAAGPCPFAWFGWDAADPGSIDNVVGPLIMFTKMMVLTGHHRCGSVSATPGSVRTSSSACVEGAHPGVARQHHAHRDLQGGVLMAKPRRFPVSSRVSASRSAPCCRPSSPTAEAAGAVQGRCHRAVPAREGDPAHPCARCHRAAGRELHQLHALRAQCPDWCIYIEAHKSWHRRAVRAAPRARSTSSTGSTSTTRCACTAASASRCARSTPCSGARSTSTASPRSPTCCTTRPLGEWMETVPDFARTRGRRREGRRCPDE
jgi:hypothetical protein